MWNVVSFIGLFCKRNIRFYSNVRHAPDLTPYATFNKDLRLAYASGSEMSHDWATCIRHVFYSFACETECRNEWLESRSGTWLIWMTTEHIWVNDYRADLAHDSYLLCSHLWATCTCKGRIFLLCSQWLQSTSGTWLIWMTTEQIWMNDYRADLGHDSCEWLQSTSGTWLILASACGQSCHLHVPHTNLPKRASFLGLFCKRDTCTCRAQICLCMWAHLPVARATFKKDLPLAYATWAKAHAGGRLNGKSATFRSKCAWHSVSNANE